MWPQCHRAPWWLLEKKQNMMAVFRLGRDSHRLLFFSPLSASCSPSSLPSPEGQPGADSLAPLHWVPGEPASLCLHRGTLVGSWTCSCLKPDSVSEFYLFNQRWGLSGFVFTVFSCSAPPLFVKHSPSLLSLGNGDLVAISCFRSW